MYFKIIIFCLVFVCFVKTSFSISAHNSTEKPGAPKEQTFKQYICFRYLSIRNKLFRFARDLGAFFGINSEKIKAAHQYVIDTVRNNPVAVFTRSGCSNCKTVKCILKNANQRYVEVKTDGRVDKVFLLDAIEDTAGTRALPSVFINGEYFGGGRVIKDLNREGKLVDVFKKALQNVTISAGDK